MSTEKNINQILISKSKVIILFLLHICCLRKFLRNYYSIQYFFLDLSVCIYIVFSGCFSYKNDFCDFLLFTIFCINYLLISFDFFLLKINTVLLLLLYNQSYFCNYLGCLKQTEEVNLHFT